MTKLQRARAVANGHGRWPAGCLDWAWERFEDYPRWCGSFDLVFASMLLDGYPAKWPRTAARKGTER